MKKNKIISFVLVTAFIFLIGFNNGFMNFIKPITISAEEQFLSFKEIVEKFPQDSYWNHVVKEGHGFVNFSDVGDCNNPDGYTWKECASHADGYQALPGEHDCNTFNSAMQCKGFVKKISYDIYGEDGCWYWDYDTYVNFDYDETVPDIKPGDIIWYRDGVVGEYWGHWAMVTDIYDSSVVLGECGIDGNCRIRWDRELDLRSCHYLSVYYAPYELTASVKSERFRAVFETPAEADDVTGDVMVQGWVLAGQDIDCVEVYVNGYVYDCTLYEREDIKKKYPWYNSRTEGFYCTVDSKAFAQGDNVIFVDAYSDGENVGTKSINVNYDYGDYADYKRFSAEYNGHIYEVYDAIVDYDDALEYCRQMGGNLAVITSSGENDFITQIMEFGELGRYLIGLESPEDNGEYNWNDGMPFIFASWADNEPEQGYKYVNIRSDGMWYTCHSIYYGQGFILEKENNKN